MATKCYVGMLSSTIHEVSVCGGSLTPARSLRAFSRLPNLFKRLWQQQQPGIKHSAKKGWLATSLSKSLQIDRRTLLHPRNLTIEQLRRRRRRPRHFSCCWRDISWWCRWRFWRNQTTKEDEEERRERVFNLSDGCLWRIWTIFCSHCRVQVWVPSILHPTMVENFKNMPLSSKKNKEATSHLAHCIKKKKKREKKKALLRATKWSQIFAKHLLNICSDTITK